MYAGWTRPLADFEASQAFKSKHGPRLHVQNRHCGRFLSHMDTCCGCTKTRSTLSQPPPRRSTCRIPAGVTNGVERIPKDFYRRHGNGCRSSEQCFATKKLCGPHRLEPASEQAPTSTELPVYNSVSGSKCPPPLPSSKSRHVHYHRPIGLWDVYVDDFLGLVQGNHHRRRQVKLALLHALDSVLRPVDDADSPHRQEPASLKKWAKETQRGRR
jgi:hypothetical protein